MYARTLYIFILGVLLMACGRQEETTSQTAAACLEEAEAALANDSIRQGETLLRKAIQLAEESEDWHTNYIAYQRLAQALSQSNPEKALQLMRKSLAMALDYTRRAYDIAATLLPPSGGDREGGSDLMCQTLTSLANIAWAKEDYRQALDYAHQAESVATTDLRPGILQVLARSYLSLNMLDSAEIAYRQIEAGNDVHMAYIVKSNLARIALRRMGATQLEDSVAEAFGQIEDFYYKALEQKDEYYQETLRQEMENQRLEYLSQIYGRTLLIVIIAVIIIIFVAVIALRYRIRMLRQQREYEQSKLEKRQLLQEAEHQRILLHQANEVVSFLQNFILERTEVMKKLNKGGDSFIYLSPNEWSEIERTLNAIDNNRFANIREQYPNMQEDDIRLCLLTRLGISNRAIGNIYCITISAVQHRKLRLKKEVFGESNPDITLEQILTN